MQRVARGYVSSRELAEDVVQETWIALLKGIAGFEGRSSVRTWLFTVLINIAKSRAVRERRDSDLQIMAFTEGTVDPARFRFWLVYRTLWWALGCLDMGRYWREGHDRSLERVVIAVPS